jgi:hypothetical protein
VKLDDYLGYFRCHAASKSSTIWDVARVESAKVWQNRFAVEWVEQGVDVGRRRILGEFCKHPLLLGFPYFETKIRKVLGGGDKFL